MRLDPSDAISPPLDHRNKTPHLPMPRRTNPLLLKPLEGGHKIGLGPFIIIHPTEMQCLFGKNYGVVRFPPIASIAIGQYGGGPK